MVVLTAGLDVGAHMLVKLHVEGFSQSWPKSLIIVEFSMSNIASKNAGLLHP